MTAFFGTGTTTTTSGDTLNNNHKKHPDIKYSTTQDDLHCIYIDPKVNFTEPEGGVHKKGETFHLSQPPFPQKMGKNLY